MKHLDAPTERLAPATSGRSLLVSIAGHVIEHPLPEAGSLVLGRGSEANVVLDDASVSRRHTTIEVGPTIRVTDLGSANGTFVGGKRLANGESAVLTPGVVLLLGKVVVLLRDGSHDAATTHGTSEIIVEDPAMEKVHALVAIAAKSALSVLLLGETGSGKEVLAKVLHESSPRAKQALVKVNCAALVESLLEAELFGYEKGAFTGANAAKPGLLETASGGTLFLDEIGEMPLATQAKLLRVVESGEVTRVGALKPRAVDVRFVSATHRDLAALVAAGRFREDLYFRLEGIVVPIPPLRARKAEVVALAEKFLADAATAAGKPAPTLLPDAVERLRRHAWPGNVRELKNVMQRSVLFATSGSLGADDLHFSTLARGEAQGSAPEEASRGLSTEQTDRRARVIAALDEAKGNQTRAAETLGIARRTLHSWMVELDVPRARER